MIVPWALLAFEVCVKVKVINLVSAQFVTNLPDIVVLFTRWILVILRYDDTRSVHALCYFTDFFELSGFDELFIGSSSSHFFLVILVEELGQLHNLLLAEQFFWRIKLLLFQNVFNPILPHGCLDLSARFPILTFQVYGVSQNVRQSCRLFLLGWRGVCHDCWGSGVSKGRLCWL